MKRIFFLWLLILVSVSSFTQNWESLNDRAIELFNKGEYENAIPFAEKAVEAAKKEPGISIPDYALSLNNLGYLYTLTGQYFKAETSLIKALEILKNETVNEPAMYLSVNFNLYQLFFKTAEYEKAKSVITGSLDFCKQILGENDPLYAKQLSAMASVYNASGEYAKAEPLYLQCIAIYRKLEENNDYYKKELGAVSNSLAGLYTLIGQNTKAENFYKQAIAILKKSWGPEHPQYASAINSLANLYKDMGEFENAEPLFIEAKEIQKRTIGENSPDYAISLNNLGDLYRLAGRDDEAEQAYLETQSIQKNIVGERHPDYAFTLNNLAVIYEKRGLFDKAETLYHDANGILLDIYGKDYPGYARGLENMAVLYAEEDKYEKADSLLFLYNDIFTRNTLKTFDVLSEREKGLLVETGSRNFEFANSLLFSETMNDTSLAENNFNRLLFLKGLTLSDSRIILESVYSSNDSSTRDLLRQWQSCKTALTRQYSFPVNKRLKDTDSLEMVAENLEKQLNRVSSAFRSRQISASVTMRDIQKNMQADEAAIEFVRFGVYNRKWTDSIMYAAYILRKNDLAPVFVPLFEEKQLQQLYDSTGNSSTMLAKNFYQAPTGNDSKGKHLYGLVWQPMEYYLKGVKKIYYSPAGKLYSLAFNALPADNTSMLMDKYQLQQYTSIRQVVLHITSEPITRPENIVLFGNPDFSMDSLQMSLQRANLPNTTISISLDSLSVKETGLGYWPDLSGSAAEVQSLKELFDKNKINTILFTREEASEKNLKSLNGHSPQVINISTHGFFLAKAGIKKPGAAFSKGNVYSMADDPLLRSGLILSGGNYAWSGKTPIEGIEDGIVTAYEISQLNLSNTKLVVLSACETALGDVKGSEGVFGLQRAFKMAGVKKMIVSLWKVPDKETSELMTSFYNYWLKGKTIGAAFAQAQTDMRKKYSPFYWAAFVLID